MDLKVEPGGLLPKKILYQFLSSIFKVVLSFFVRDAGTAVVGNTIDILCLLSLLVSCYSFVADLAWETIVKN